MVSQTEHAVDGTDVGVADAVTPELIRRDIGVPSASTPGGELTLQHLLDVDDLIASGFTTRGRRSGHNTPRIAVDEHGVRVADNTNLTTVPAVAETDEAVPDAGRTLNMSDLKLMMKEMFKEMLEEHGGAQGERRERNYMGEYHEATRPRGERDTLLYERYDRAPRGRMPLDRERERVEGVGLNESHLPREGSGPHLTSGRDFGLTASVGNTRFSIAQPAKFNPETSNWMLWKPQVFSYFEMLNLSGVLDPANGHRYTLQENRYVIGALQSMVPDQDAQWMSTLQLKFAYQAWEQLEKAYGCRAELDMQQKMFEFEQAHQREHESIRQWTVRLERMVTELNVMSKQAAKECLLGYGGDIDTAVQESSHKYRLLNVNVRDQALEAYLANLRCKVMRMSVQDVENALVSYEQANTVQKALSGNAGHTDPVYATYPYHAGRGGRGGRGRGRGGRGGYGRTSVYGHSEQQERECYACGGVGHGWHTCPSRLTIAGRERLAKRNISLPAKDLRPDNGNERRVNTVNEENGAPAAHDSAPTTNNRGADVANVESEFELH